MSGFFEELKRRNVFRVGAAYAVVAWLTVQVVVAVFPVLGVPEWASTMVVILSIVGLPISLVVAWFYELTPEGLQTQRQADQAGLTKPATFGRQIDFVVIALMAIAIAWLVYDKETGPDAPERSIAVLPFVNMSADPEQEYFSDGLSEEVLNVLVKLPDLKVTGRTSSFQFKGQNLDLRNIGAVLGVAYILEGSVRKQGEQVRITAQLVRASDGFHLWSDAYNRDLSDIFVVQEEIAEAIAGELAVELGAGARTALSVARTENIGAYDTYLKARSMIARRGPAAIVGAIELLEAVTRDNPEYAPAWGALAQAHSLSPYYSATPQDMAIARTEAAAQKALALEPDLAIALNALGDAYRDSNRWEDANDAYSRALAINPNEVEARSQYSQFLTRAGYFGEALVHAEKAVELDPVSAINASVLANLLLDLQRIFEAEEAIERALLLGPDLRYIRWTQNSILLAQGKIAAAKLNAGDVARISRLRDAEFAEAMGGLADLLEVQDVNPEAVLEYIGSKREAPRQESAVIFWQWAAFYGDPELVADFIRTDVNNPQIRFELFQFWSPLLSAARGTETAKDVMRQIGLVDFWRANRWPDLCRPAGEDDFDCE